MLLHDWKIRRQVLSSPKKVIVDFIPAKESKFIIWFFDWYTRFIIWRRFKHVHISQDYFPNSNSKTVYFVNHNYWWDGLLPLYLNRKLFKQQARALMEDKQMRQYPFFSKIGAFSINLNTAKSVIFSLRYAISSFTRKNASLYIYPEGKLTPVTDTCPKFKDGLSWLYQVLEEVDFVPVAFYIDYSKSEKPELFISIGKSVNPGKALSKKELSLIFEKEVHQLLKGIKGEILTSHISD